MHSEPAGLYADIRHAEKLNLIVTLETEHLVRTRQPSAFE
jgi:hypothetical protein